MPAATQVPGGGGATAANIQNFQLPNLSITAGTTVRWVNQDSVPHTATAGSPGSVGDEFASSSLSQGGTFEHTFDTAGRYDYFCQIHPDMTGSIVVSGEAPDPTATVPVATLTAPTATATAAATATLVPTSTPAVATPTAPPATAAPSPTPAGPTATPDSGGEQYSAEIEGFAHPAAFTIQAGTTVKWTNLDNALHTVSSGTPESPTSEFNSPGMTQNQTYTFTFDEPGEYPYFCSPHPFMRGRVIVE
jgi:amicyanin